VAEAAEEGIEILDGSSPVKFVSASTANLSAVEYVKIENLKLSPLSFDKVEGSGKTLPADFVIIATGQTSDKAWAAAEGVILAGDIAGGKCSVIDAMASGRAAALQIDNELLGREYTDFETDREPGPGERRYKVYPATRQKLLFEKQKTLPVSSRIRNFDLVELALDEAGAKLDVLRCMSCGYRFVDTEKCIGCGVCQKVCPKGDVISLIAAPDGEKEGK
jgi:NAD-dependent dihydropyrimidine dehydrogenase PreA subunit